ncbi:type II secretion system F family protein [Candidatus Saccharibacteria bacterium]|nr:type II secretion system F family protein [Candidatus Saccharibacteria bacterium]
MPDFRYIVITESGHPSTGVVSASSRQMALANLRASGKRPISMKEVKAKKSRLSFGKKVKIKDLVIFTRELSTMISAGVPLPRGLDILAQQTENKYFKEIISDVNHDVEGGMALADAFAKHPRVFSEVYVNMVRAGEAGGLLDDIMKRIALQVEKDSSIRHKIKSAMAYPVVILAITVIAFFGIMLFIIPKIGKILQDLGGPEAKLPIYTQMMLDISSFLTGHSITQAIPIINQLPIISSLPNVVLLLALMGIGIVYLRRYIRTPVGQYQFHALLLKLPVLRTILIKIAVARFARTFSSLMSSGVTVLEALEVTGKAIGNRVIQKQLADVAIAVKNGQSLGKQLLNTPYFPPIVGQMIIVGEETGKIDEVLVKVAEFYEEEVDTVIDSLASIIEPVMIVVLGAAVGLIAASVMGPIAGLSKNVEG